MLITNAFSLNMLPAGVDVASLTFTRLTAEQAGDWVHSETHPDLGGGALESAVGHADTARLFSTILGCPVPCNRATVQVGPETRMLVGQYSGPRLPEGATSLPEGAKVEWFSVRWAAPAPTLDDIDQSLRAQWKAAMDEAHALKDEVQRLKDRLSDAYSDKYRSRP